MKNRTKTMPSISLGIPEKDKTGISKKLNQLLADQHILYIKMRNFHWNLVGPSFVEVHEFIEKLYVQTALDIDVIAERIQQLGYTAAGSMKEFLQLATISESKTMKKTPGCCGVTWAKATLKTWISTQKPLPGSTLLPFQVSLST